MLVFALTGSQCITPWWRAQRVVEEPVLAQVAVARHPHRGCSYRDRHAAYNRARVRAPRLQKGDDLAEAPHPGSFAVGPQRPRGGATRKRYRTPFGDEAIDFAQSRPSGYGAGGGPRGSPGRPDLPRLLASWGTLHPGYPYGHAPPQIPCRASRYDGFEWYSLFINRFRAWAGREPSRSHRGKSSGRRCT
jgi:hypothetical protein